MKEIRIGISGWTFAPWRGRFYPKKLAQKLELEYASQQVNSIEVNGTFYSLQRPTTFQTWYSQTPENFLFALKAPRYMTHILRLKDCAEPLSTFLASGLLCLKEKLGPILWQFPPYVTLKDDRFEKFIQMLPQNSIQAAELAKKHSRRIDGRAWTQSDGDYPVRHAFEFRHDSFLHPDFLALLKAHHIAAVYADSVQKGPLFQEPTADFVYVRMQGENPAFKKGYTDSALKKMAEQAGKWAGKKDVFLYFNNDEKVNSPTDALRMMKLLKIKWHPEEVEIAA